MLPSVRLMKQDVYFRAGVGLLVTSGEGRVLALERSDVPGAWQAPQGGLIVGEEPLTAAMRELAEETGIDWSTVTLLAEYPEWLAYELPPSARNEKTGRGQVQKWFLLRLDAPVESIILAGGGAKAEFSAWRWMRPSELVDKAWSVRQPIYERLMASWSHLLEA